MGDNRFFVAWSGLHDKAWSIRWGLTEQNADRVVDALRTLGYSKVVKRPHQGAV